MKAFELPKQVLFGSATAATQIEGGDTKSNWYHWSLAGRIAKGGSSIIAADHWNRVKEDVALMKEMNHEIYRFSIEWSRIEPEKGVWSQEGIKHYQEEVADLKKAGIKPLVTLHHFSHPQWFEEMGAWTNPRSVFYFRRFTEKVLEAIGDEVNEYCTINEPNVFVTDTYMDNHYPPGRSNDIVGYFKAAENMVRAHIKVYKLIHKYRQAKGHDDTMVGMALHMAYFEVHGNSPLTKLSKGLMDHAFHQMFLKGMVEGKFTLPIGIGYSLGKGTYCDFIGINYYSRHLIHSSKNPAMLFGEVKVEENLPNKQVNDLGWEIYPQGMYSVCEMVYKTYKLPIYITENGIPDEKDTKRSKFIYDHIWEIKKMVEDGIDVRRYYHWSLMDNLEWNDGFYPRFGLVAINYDTLERTIRDSGRFYGALIKNKKITEEMISRYLSQA